MAEEELARFRREWQQEVTARNRGMPSAQTANNSLPPATRRLSSRTGKPPRTHRPSISKNAEKEDDLGIGNHDHGVLDEREQQEPGSALEHYERAVEQETQGKLEDSLIHYRKAFKLDDRVDLQYKNKHFPPSSFAGLPRLPDLNPSNASSTVPNFTHQSLHEPPTSNTLPTGSELLASFAHSAILGLAPPIEGTPPPLCPIAAMPQEILADILLRTALLDVASFVRLAQVCRRLAYIVGTEERIWKRTCQGPEWGFGAMHYRFACTLEGKALPRSISTEQDIDNEDDAEDLSADLGALVFSPLSAPHLPSIPSRTPCVLPILSLLPPIYPTYVQMFHIRPRLRFSGLYISTVNYVRPGASTPSQVTWNSPVHVVTYYRYLRFFRSGSCLSLLTTVEPAEVVPHMREEVAPKGGKVVVGAGDLAVGGPGLQAVAKHGLRGRWRLSGSLTATAAAAATAVPSLVHGTTDSAAPYKASDLSSPSSSTAAAAAPSSPEAQHDRKSSASSTSLSGSEPEGHVLIETAGVTPAYTYSMRLRLESLGGKKNSGGGGVGGGIAGGQQNQARNTRLAWEGFWSYNRLTDDWAQFHLKNDKPFVWSRVRSWGDA